MAAPYLEQDTYIHKLLDVGLITHTALAVRMWPQLNSKVAYNKLYNKLHRKGNQRVTPEDIENARSVCEDFKLLI